MLKRRLMLLYHALPINKVSNNVKYVKHCEALQDKIHSFARNRVLVSRDVQTKGSTVYGNKA